MPQSPVRFSARIAISVMLLALATSASADIDLTGRWRALDGRYADIVQTGNQVAVAWTQYLFGGGDVPMSVAGTFDQTTLSADGSGWHLSATQLGGGTVLDGLLSTTGIYSYLPVRFTRCECYDGNETDGDGCDSNCLVEPCYACSSEPSTCLPVADSASCDDRNDCSTGETCSAGICGGGATVTPCVNMTGSWRLHIERSNFPYTTTSILAGVRTFEQRNGVLRSGGEIGSIDTATGEFDITQKGGSYTCSESSDFRGAGSLDNLTLDAAGASYFPQLHYCLGIGHTALGYRCVEEPGCDLTDCSSVPEGTACDDEDASTSNTVCYAGVCRLACPPCMAPHESGGCIDDPMNPDCIDPCSLCTVWDGASSSCVPAPKSDCRQSLKPETGRIQIARGDEPERNDVRWMWKQGAATSPEDFGSPQTTDDVALCVFGESGGVTTARGQMTLYGESSCTEPPCWSSKNDKMTFKARGEQLSPFSAMTLRSGEDGKASINLRGRGEQIDLHGYLPVPAGMTLRTQLQIENGSCFELNFDTGGISRNADGVFKASGAAASE